MFSSPTEYQWDRRNGSSYRASPQLRYDIAPQARFSYGKIQPADPIAAELGFGHSPDLKQAGDAASLVVGISS